MKLLRRIAIAVVLVGLFAWLGMPRVLSRLGLHPECAAFDGRLDGRSALVVSTSHGELGEGGAATGVASSELTSAYYEFLDAGMDVDVASVRGGDIPVDPQSLLWLVRSHYDDRYLEDPELKAKVAESAAVGDVDLAAYDIVYLAGGWGAAFDLGTSAELAQGMTDAVAANRVIGGVCHGPLGLLGAKAVDGSPFVLGRRLTAVTDKQVRELGIESSPQHPERELRAAGALFESATRFRDLFASKVVRDGRLVTGQNQNSGCETAQQMMRVLLEEN